MSLGTVLLQPNLIAGITMAEPLIGYYLARSTLHDDPELPGYAAIDVMPSGTHLWLNLKRFEALPVRQQIGVLIHEFLHLTLLHCSKRSFGLSQDAWVSNVAQDMAINPVILQHFELPDGAVMPDNGGYNFPRYKSAEFYFDELSKDQPKFEATFGAPPPPPNFNSLSVISKISQDYLETHGYWGGSGLIATACGSPKLARELLRQRLETVDWRAQIRDFLKQHSTGTWGPSYKRPSRRFGEYAPGKVLRPKPFVPVILDTSASMGGERMKAVVDEVLSLADNAHVQLLQCDTQVNVVADLVECDTLKIVGFGGTDLQPAFDQIQAAGHQACCCMSDEEFVAQPDTHGLRVLWFNPKTMAIRSTF